MRRTAPTAATPLFALLLLSTPLQILAHPYPLQDTQKQQDAAYRYLMPRQCVLRCGYQDLYCCNAGEACYTSNGIAGCTTNGGGAYGIYTTTWTVTNTFTSTVTTDWAPAPTAGTGGGGWEPPCVPKSPEQTPCGKYCCAGDQYCAWEGQCYPKAAGGGGGGGGGGWTSVITTNGIVTTQYSAPYRVTSSTATGTLPTPSTSGTTLPVTGGTGANLSPGAIAGIVIGVLAGIGLLMLLCFCCIARGLWALLCGGKKKKKEHRRERVDVTEERYSRHGSRHPSAHSRRDNHSSWFGGRPSSAGHRNEKHSSGKKWLGIAAAAGTLLALLNLRKNHKKKAAARKPRGSARSDSYYSYTGTSPSSSSSGGRTHNTRHTRTTRHSRH